MRASRGFTLIEIVVVLVIIAVLTAMAAAVTRGVTSQQKRSLTATRMQAIDAALVQFVSLQKRLPCPADGTIVDPANAQYGIEFGRTGAGCPAASNEANGIVPWKTLGLADEDVNDGWEHRFTYRIPLASAADNALDMSLCDPASPNPPNDPNVAVASCSAACSASNISACTPPQSFLINKGLQIRKVDGTVIMDPNPATPPPTGAAYVLISHGETGGGALTSAGQVVPNASDGAQEQANYAAQPLAGWYFADEQLETPHFDDIVSRPSMSAVINKAALGPRSH